LDTNENSYFRSNLSEDLQQCSGLYRSLAAAVRPPDQQLSSFIEAGICGTGTYILLSGDWRSGGNDSVRRLCVCVRYQRLKSQSSYIFAEAKKQGLGGIGVLKAILKG
jgi:hypothetical protein